MNQNCSRQFVGEGASAAKRPPATALLGELQTGYGRRGGGENEEDCRN